MSNRNATASWSGYSHQGQVGLLVALRKLQEAGVDLSTHFVQFETHEDVAIYQQPIVGAAKTYLSVHQVKAYYSAANAQKSTYSTVLNGTFEQGNVRYLHTTAEITDWTTSATTNNNNVSLYPYNGAQNYCGTTDIETFIKAELNTILGHVGQAVIEAAYCRLSFELDHRIRTEHQKAHKFDFDIKFSMAEIDALIKDNSPFTQKNIHDCRKLFYDTYIDIIRNENLTQTRIDAIESSIIKHVNSLDDKGFLLLLQRMNLNETTERLKSAAIYYNSPGLKQVFFRMLIDIIDTDPLLMEHVVKYNKNGEASKFVLTAIIEEERDKLTVIEKILSNLQSQDLLWENHSLINKDIEADLIARNPSIN